MRLPPRERAGFSLVELMVVMALVGIVSVFAGYGFLRASRLEKAMRREAFVRTSLVLGLDRLERQISLADEWWWETADGKRIESATSLSDGVSCDVCLGFPLEAGGVSLETNRISQVFFTRLHPMSAGVESTFSNVVDHVMHGTSRRMDPSPLLETVPEETRLAKLSVSNAAPGFLSVRLDASVVAEDVRGDEIRIPVSAERLVKLWNVN